MTILFVLGTAQCVNAQADSAAELPKTHPVTLPRAEYFDLRSKAGRDYRIFVSGPKQPASDAGSPVIYLTDGNAHFPLVLSAAQRQVRDSMPCVVVGIGYPTEDPKELRTFRSFDLTPPTSAEWVAANSKQLADLKTGGNDQFAEFIQTELKPIIERKYKIDRNRQTLLGHSFGGLFALHVLFTRPEMFQTYVAASPSIWFSDGAILKEEQKFVERFRDQPIPARLLLTVGELEQASPGPQSGPVEKEGRRGGGAAAINGMSKRLSEAGLKGFTVQTRVFNEETHGSVILPAASRGVKFALEDQPRP
jgi:predicted alpha/beta superfamily hydrolase